MSANIRRLIILVLVTILATATLSCGNNNSPPKKPATTSTQKPPPELEKMKKDLAELETMLEKRMQQEDQGSASLAQSSKQESKKAEKESKKSGGSQEDQSKQAAAQKQEWTEEMKMVRNLHSDWNGLEPEAVTKGMNTPTQVALEENLSNLTRAVEDRQALDAELAANQVFRYYIEAAALFKTGMPPNLSRIRYHVNETRLQGTTGEWPAAETEAMKAVEIWQRLSYSLDKIDRQKLYQMEHSLTDLAEAVTQRSLILMSIKTEIALQNLDQLERQIKGTMNGGG